MAAVFGVAASVSGIVSLGLELSTRIATYINSVRYCDEEISAIHRQIETFRSSIDILKNAIPGLALKHQIASDTVLTALKSGQLELEALNDFVEKLTGSTGQSQNLKSNFKHATKKITFPFHRSSLEALQQRLDGAIASLDSATRALGLVIISSIDRSSADALSQLSSISATSTANNTTSSSIKASLDTFIPQADQALLEVNNSLRTGLPNIQQGLASVSAAITRQEEGLTRRIQEVQAEFRDSLNKTPNQIVSLNSFMSSLDIAPTANPTPRSKLFGETNKLIETPNAIAGGSESDPRRLLGASTEQRVLYCLVSSPAQLEKLYNLYCEKSLVENESAVEQHNDPGLGFKRGPNSLMGRRFAAERSISTCICQQRHKSLRQQAKLAGFSFTRLTRICWKHLPECRYAKSEVVYKSNSMRLSYDGLRWLLSKAVDISISLHTGPEGLKIEPSITLRPVVDARRAPTFQGLAYVRPLRIIFAQYGQMSKYMTVLELVVHRIVQQYMSRKSSPYEVNSKGQSVLHKWMELVGDLSWLWDEFGSSFIAMTELLLEAGVPALLCDDRGQSPGTQLLIKDLHSMFAFKRLMLVLCEEAPEAPIYNRYDVTPDRMSRAFQAFLGLRDTIEASEIFGCGPLSSAILVGDEAKVRNIIARYPSTINERNLMLQTPFHLASCNPKILRLLMPAAKPQEVNGPDHGGNYALDYALRLTSSLCLNGNSWVACSGCLCIQSVEIFLSNGWGCNFNSLQHCDSMSHTARLRLIDHFASQRAVLKALGQQFLPVADVDRYRLNEPSVLDYHAHRVAELLLRYDISIPALVYETLPQGPSSIYHNKYIFKTASCSQLAQLLYDKGFRDTHKVDNNGYFPLSTFIKYGWVNKSSHFLWLIEHGANILHPFWLEGPMNPYEYSHDTAELAKCVLRCIPHPDDLPHEVESYRRLVSLVASLDQHDKCHCRCQCIETGCHPIKSFIKTVWQQATNRYDTFYPEVFLSTSVSSAAQKLSNILQIFSLGLTEWDNLIALALRYLTFEALELTHTCCRIGFATPFGCPEEIAEIEDENREKLDLLELLLREFQIDYYKFETQDMKGGKFANFLTEVWATRMKQVLAGIESIQLTADEKREAEEIGVRWNPALEYRYERGQEEEKKAGIDLEFWLKLVDEIMPAV
ncbi:hypothetical protein GGR51DRAFT_504882 [Nemania sp. FL0031]|nr:hypothetical protein GGR51DRAFT_504882 [Nemania sp. FL0031]